MRPLSAPPAGDDRPFDPRSFAVGVGIMTAGLAAAAATRLPFAWDGSWFFVKAMDSGSPTFLYRRAIHAVLQAPALLSRLLLEDVAVSGWLFSAAYALLPLVALLAAWWIVRNERPALITWPILGIALVALPGQAFFVSEGAFVAALSWPLVLAAALGRIERHRLLVAGLALALAASHPYSGPALGAVGIVAWVARARGTGTTRTRVIWGLLAAGALVTTVDFVLRTPYEIEASSVGRLVEQFRGGVAGRPLIAPLAAWLVGAAVFVRVDPRIRNAAIVAILVVTAVALVPWALHPQAWAQSLRFRSSLVFLELPLFGLAVLDALRPAHSSDRRVVSIGAPAVMAVVLASQGLSWLALQTRLAAAIASAQPGCLTTADIDWVRTTPLAHWSVTSLGIALEGRDPRHLLLYERPCDAAIDATRVVIKESAFDRDARPIDGWWGFHELVQGATAP